MSFGKIIKRLRVENNMTQENLAEILSISPQAISRWETNMAMPDISLIAPLCNLFNVTSDELLEIDAAHRKSAVIEISNASDKYSQRGYLEEARRILEDGLKKYPGNCELEYKLMTIAYWQRINSDGRKYIEETIRLGEEILSKSTDDYHRHGAIQTLCYAYKDVGRIEEAEKMANSMPFIACSQEMLKSTVYSGSKAYTAEQHKAFNLLRFLSNSLISLQTTMDNGESSYTDEEYATLLKKRISLFDLFFENGDFGFFHTHLCDTHKELAVYYAKTGDERNELLHIESAAEHAIKFITSVSEERTSLVFRGQIDDCWASGSKDNQAKWLLKELNNNIFEGVRQTDEFQRIQNRLYEYSGEWCVN